MKAFARDIVLRRPALEISFFVECEACGTALADNPLTCAACHSVSYCNEACERAHAVRHGLVCPTLVAALADAHAGEIARSVFPQ